MKLKRILLILASFLAFSFASCKMDLYTSEFNDVTISEPTTNSTETTFSGEAPKVVKASKASYTNKIVISWYSVSGAEYYEIARAKSAEDLAIEYAADGSELTSLESYLLPRTTISTSIEDSSALETGTRYYYRVRGRATGESAGKWSSVTSGSLLSTSTPSASKGKYTGRITITWDEVPDVYGYKIYKSTTGSFDNTLSPIGTVHATNQEQAEFSYAVTDDEDGANLFFAIKSVSPNQSEISDFSTSTMGYSLVIGAPGTPTGVSADQGAVAARSSGNAINIRWAVENSEYQYTIYRSAPGSSDLQVYPSTGDYAAVDLDPSDEQKYLFTDSNGIAAGTRYTYTIIPVGEDADGEYLKGKPAEVDGYLLSNPSDAEIELLKDSSGNAIQRITFTQPVGLDTEDDRTAHSSWKYIISEPAGDEGEVGTHSEELPATSYQDSDTVTWDCTDKTWRDFTIQVSNGTTTTTPTSTLSVEAPGTPSGFAVSSNKWQSGMSANSNGIYPVVITWDSSDIIEKYVIQRFAEDDDMSDESTALGTFEVDGSDNSFEDDNTSAQAGEKYKYRIKCVDILDQEGSYSTGVLGYGAITPQKLIHYWYIYAFKPFDSTANAYLPTSITNSFYTDFNLQSYWSPSNSGTIGWMVAQGKKSSLSDQMNALGDDEMACHYAHGSSKGSDHTTDGNTEDTTNFGTVSYDASTEGIGGQIYFTYSNFGELSWMYTTGKYEMHVDASGDGSAKSSGLSIKGMYPATVLLDDISVESKDFVGNFVVVMSDGQPNGSVDSSISANL